MMENTWNIISELIRREYGFSGRIDRRPFTTNCLGSLYIVQHMQWTHRLNESRNIFECMNFSNDRNLICTGNRNTYIDVYDWKKKKLKFSLKTNHSRQLYNVKFLNTGGNGMDLISSDDSGQVRHTCIAPSGYYVSNRILLNYRSDRLLTVPGSPLQFLACGSTGGIFQIDLREENWSSTPNSIITKEPSFPSYCVTDMAHHPFAPEISICGYDKFVRVIDKRNLKEPVKKLYPNNLTNGDTSILIHCSYNYNGSEILAHYPKEGAYLFDNQSNVPGNFLQFFSDVDKGSFRLFGSTSEYMIYYNGEKIEFRDKKTNIVVWTVFRDFTEIVYSILMEVHPQLPVIATSHTSRELDIWNTTVLGPY